MTTSHPASTTRRAGRFENLDGLRGVAALVVLVYHGFMVIPQFSNPEFTGRGAGNWAWFDYSPLRILLSGTEGVLVFFVLSGFVLTLPVLRARASSRRFAWRAYYPSRLLRLYLPVFASLVWALLVIAVLPRAGLLKDPSIYMEVHSEPVTLLRIARDAILIDGVNGINGPLWSLQWEVAFSLLLPLYVFLAIRLKRWWLPLAILLAVVSGLAAVIGRPSLTYLPAFAIGALFATALPKVEGLIRRINESARHRGVWLALTIVASLLLTARWTLAPLLHDPLLGITMAPVLLGAALFVFIALGSELAKRMLTTPGIQWLGMISFSLYLTHEPIVVGVAQLLPSAYEPLSVILSVPIALVVGWLFYQAVEKPAHRFSQFVKRRLTPPVQVEGERAPLEPVS